MSQEGKMHSELVFLQPKAQSHYSTYSSYFEYRYIPYLVCITVVLMVFFEV